MALGKMEIKMVSERQHGERVLGWGGLLAEPHPPSPLPH